MDGYGNYLADIRPQAAPPVPRRGTNDAFDAYFLDKYPDDFDDEETEEEMRRATWATWRVQAPTTVSGNGGRAEDDELERALALSREDFAANGDGRGTQGVPIDLADDDDEDLKRVLAMSMEEAREPKRRKREETPAEEKLELERALQASMAESSGDNIAGPSSTSLSRLDSDDAIERANDEYRRKREADREQQRRERELKNGSKSITATPKLATPPPPASGVASSSTTQTFGVKRTAPTAGGGTNAPTGNAALKPGGLAYDRAQIERERLARQQAREQGSNGAGNKTGDAPPPRTANGAIASSSTPFTFNGPSSNQTSFKAVPPSLHPFQGRGPYPRDAAGEYYPDGELRHSALTVVDPTSKPTFNLPDVIGKKSQIAFLFLNSFVLDDEWLGQILPTPDVCPQVIIRPHDKGKPEHNGMVQVMPSGELFVYPKMIGEWGSAHMKFIWIWYKTGRLRVVISTANFVPYDWDYIENTVFVQDFLPLSIPRPLDPAVLSNDLPCQFRHLFGHLRLHKAIKFLVEKHPLGSTIPFSHADNYADLNKYDWSRLRVKVVMSIPGTYSDYSNMQKFGMCRLGQVLREEGWGPKRDEAVASEYQCSSLGQYGADWFNQFHGFCSGKSVQQVHIIPTTKSYANMKVLYPSLATVDASKLGRDGGGTMFVGKSWNANTKKLFYDSNSKRGGVLMHAKVLVSLYEPKSKALGFQSSQEESPDKGKKRKADQMEEKEHVGGWVYVGSHNFSSAAWGTMNLKPSTPSLNIRNYELGIVFPLPAGKAREAADAIVPYQRPARPYSATDVPWDQKLHRQADDE